MFKVGNKVQIKSRSEIRAIDIKLGAPLPLNNLLEYCGKIGKIVRISKDCRNGFPFIELDITKHYYWYDHELTLYKPDNIFILPEDLCLQ